MFSCKIFPSCFTLSYPRRFAHLQSHPSRGLLRASFLCALLRTLHLTCPVRQVKNHPSILLLQAWLLCVFPPGCQDSCVKDMVVKLYKLQPLEKKKMFYNHFFRVPYPSYTELFIKMGKCVAVRYTEMGFNFKMTLLARYIKRKRII